MTIKYTPPSIAQQNAARIISSTLNIPMPKEFSSKAYWNFISQNIERSKQVAKERHTSSTRHITYHEETNYIESKCRAQRQADWDATYLLPDVWVQRVLDGGLPPSWIRGTADEFRRDLRSLGYKSSLEKELERERERRLGWCGLEGDGW